MRVGTPLGSPRGLRRGAYSSICVIFCWASSVKTYTNLSSGNLLPFLSVALRVSTTAAFGTPASVTPENPSITAYETLENAAV